MCLRLIVRVQRACVGKDQTERTEEDLAAEEDESLQFATPVLQRSARWEMAARDSFKMSPREVEKIEAKCEKRKFVEASIDLFNPYPEDDTCEDRTIWEFGPMCPLPLLADVPVCKAYKEKTYGCRSCMSETVARLHLAKSIAATTPRQEIGNGRLQRRQLGGL